MMPLANYYFDFDEYDSLRICLFCKRNVYTLQGLCSKCRIDTPFKFFVQRKVEQALKIVSKFDPEGETIFTKILHKISGFRKSDEVVEIVRRIQEKTIRERNLDVRHEPCECCQGRYPQKCSTGSTNFQSEKPQSSDEEDYSDYDRTVVLDESPPSYSEVESDYESQSPHGQQEDDGYVHGDPTKRYVIDTGSTEHSASFLVKPVQYSDYSRDEERRSRELDSDFVKSFSSLSVQIRNDEIEKIHDALKSYRERDDKLNEKLLKSDFKAEDFDYFPRAGDKDHDLWDLKARHDQDAYLKVLFFRDAQPRRYSPQLIQGSLDRLEQARGTLVDRFGIEINRANLACLLDTNWLNDEIINFYLQMLQEQSSAAGSEHALPSCFFFNTFFFQALCGNDAPGVLYDYRAVARWTRRRRVNVFEKDLLMVPVHVSKVHWALGVVDMRRGWRRIMLFDSLGGKNPTWFRNIRRWLQDEHQDKLGAALDAIDDWAVPKGYRSEPYAPTQRNSYDCGLFLCQYAKGISFATGFGFTKESSAYLRRSMIHEILSCKVAV